MNDESPAAKLFRESFGEVIARGGVKPQATSDLSYGFPVSERYMKALVLLDKYHKSPWWKRLWMRLRREV